MVVPLTLGSTNEDSLANHKILSHRSSPDIRYYLPASDDGDRTMKHSSSELDMRGILVVPLVLCAPAGVHVDVVEVPGQLLLVMRLRLVVTAGGLIKRSWRVYRNVHPIERSLEYLDVDHSVWCYGCEGALAQYSCSVFR
jgi:hypothetical protein